MARQIAVDVCDDSLDLNVGEIIERLEALRAMKRALLRSDLDAPAALALSKGEIVLQRKTPEAIR